MASQHTGSVSSGSSTQPAAEPATTQGAPPTTAAPSAVPASNVSSAPRPPARKDYTPKSGFSSTLVTKTGGLSQMLTSVSEVTFAANTALAASSYVVPNCTIFYAILNIMDTQMATTKRFTDANPDWLPLVSQLYFSWLIFYLTLKCQSVGNNISMDQRLFLEFLEDQFNVSTLKIPGPLVPFFQSLAACSGPNGRYGNVTFGIPDVLHVTQSQSFLAVNRFNANLPSPIVILDQLMRYIQRIAPVGAIPGAINLSMTDYFYLDIFGVTASPNAANRVCMKTPHARSEIHIPQSVAQAFAQSTGVWRSVLPFSPATNQSTYVPGNNANPLNFAQVLGFSGFGDTNGRNFPWFQHAARIMQPYADFFRDSISLGAISTTGIGSIYVENAFLNSTDNAIALTSNVTTRDVRYMAPGTPRYSIPNLDDLKLVAIYQEDELDLVAEQLGMLSGFNTTWSSVNNLARSVFPGPIDGNVKTGPVWDRQIQKATRHFTPVRSAATIISGYFHVPVAGKFGN